jgi:hypothetical protein
MNDLARLRGGMNNRQMKKLAAEKHNEAYLESLKPKPPRPERKRDVGSMGGRSRIPLAVLCASIASVTEF